LEPYQIYIFYFLDLSNVRNLEQLPYTIAALFINYFLFQLGLKVIGITSVSRTKIIVYLILQTLIGLIFGESLNKLLYVGISSLTIRVFFGHLAFAPLTYLIIRFYFQIDGKKAWLLLIYLSSIYILINITYNLSFLAITQR